MRLHGQVAFRNQKISKAYQSNFICTLLFPLACFYLHMTWIKHILINIGVSEYLEPVTWDPTQAWYHSWWGWSWCHRLLWSVGSCVCTDLVGQCCKKIILFFFSLNTILSARLKHWFSLHLFWNLVRYKNDCQNLAKCSWPFKLTQPAASQKKIQWWEDRTEKL